MDKDLKDRWITALESGEYKQGGRHLRTGHAEGGSTYSALGVLADLVCSDGWIETDWPELYGWKLPDTFAFAQCLPISILSTHEQLYFLTAADTDTSFAEIASWIRGNIDGS